MEYPTYTVASLERVLRSLEQHYGMSSAAFMAAHMADAPEVASIPGFTRHSWASFCVEWREVEGAADDDGFADHVEHELALA